MIMLERIVIMSTVAVILFSPVLQSQAHPSSGTKPPELKGVVVDRSGAPLPRTFVELRTPAGEAVASVYTNSRGEFELTVPAGEYRLTAALAGFARLQERSIAIGASNPLLRLELEVAPLEHQVVV